MIEGRGLPVRQRRPGTVPVFGSNGVAGFHDEALVPHPTIVVGRKGSAGAIRYVLEPSFPIDTTYFVKLRAPEQADLSFVAIALERLDLTRLAVVTGVPGLNREDAYRERVPMPPLAEQRRIVDLLNRAAGIRRLREAALAKARETIPALFLSMFGDPATNPKGWVQSDLRALLTEAPRNGLSPATGGKHPGSVLTLSAITGGRFRGDAVKAAAFGRPITARDTVAATDLLICRGNGNADLVGRGFLPDSAMPDVAFPDTMIAVRPNAARIVPAFLEAVWASSGVRAHLAAEARTTNGTFKINQMMVSAVRIPVPQLPLQHLFAARLADLRAIIAQQERALAIARDTERALMAQLLG